jgi:hypothetical protein
MDNYEFASWLARMPLQSKQEHNWMMSSEPIASFRQQVNNMYNLSTNTPHQLDMDQEEVD